MFSRQWRDQRDNCCRSPRRHFSNDVILWLVIQMGTPNFSSRRLWRRSWVTLLYPVNNEYRTLKKNIHPLPSRYIEARNNVRLFYVSEDWSLSLVVHVYDGKWDSTVYTYILKINFLARSRSTTRDYVWDDGFQTLFSEIECWRVEDSAMQFR